MDTFAAKPSDLAVVGMSCIFPEANSPSEFWDNLKKGVDAMRPLDDQTIKAAIEEYDPATKACVTQQFRSGHYVKKAALLKDPVETFDASFFGFNPNEAELLDPQQRKFLELAWHALENAGYDAKRFPGLIGVFAGTNLSRYFLVNVWSNRKIMHSERELLGGIGNEQDYVSNRVAYKLDLKGPAITLQSACSTSLVAVHFACQSLLNGECDMALAGGIRIQVPHNLGYMHNEGDMTSPDGCLRAFDAQANGTVFGRGGGGCVVLKRLDDALAAGDHIHAVVKGSAVNNDGADKAGYTAPSVKGQVQVISEALAMAEVDPETVTYIEAHGTGTPLGDPIEISALSQVYGSQTSKKQYCAVGSVKTNVGHLAEAAGIAAFIKTVLSLKHGQIVPSLHYETPNPRIDFQNSPFYVNTQLKAWEPGGAPRRAGVSAFGVGGTNAHIVLEEAPKSAAHDRRAQDYHVLHLSAKTETALAESAKRLATHLKERPDLDLGDVAHTLHEGRRLFNHRLIVTGRDAADIAGALETLDPKKVYVAKQDKQDSKAVFMFSGQGSQYINMGRELYGKEPVFKDTLDQCAEQLKPVLTLDIRDLIFPAVNRADQAAAQLQETRLTQPILFALEYSLARVWMHWGVQPESMLGHSIGEYTAACIAGVFSLHDALTLVAKRGALMQSLPEGGMLSLAVDETKARTFLNERRWLATVNAPDSCVISGSHGEMDVLEKELQQQHIACRRLRTSHAFHSGLMDPILEPFRQAVAACELHPPRIPVVSNLSRCWLTAQEAVDPDYWVRHLRSTVHFSGSMEFLLSDPKRIFIEVGPGNTLTTLVRRQPGLHHQGIYNSLPHPNERQPDCNYMLTAAGRAWLSGIDLDWKQVNRTHKNRRCELPGYPFERRKYWVEAKKDGLDDASGLDKKPNLRDWYYVPAWKQAILSPESRTEDNHAVWMIFKDELGVSDELATLIKQQGRQVIVVEPDTAYAQAGPAHFKIVPDQKESYAQLFQAVQQAGLLPQVVIHAWHYTGKTIQQGVHYYEAMQKTGFHSLVALAQAVGTLDQPMKIAVVTDYLANVQGRERMEPEKATILGPIKVIPLEHTQLQCAGIDLAGPDERDLDVAAEQIINEVEHGLPDRIVAYRGIRRWTQVYESVPVSGPAKKQNMFKAGMTYLITGGLGGLGLVQAEAIAKTVPANLVLIGRTPLPARAAWDRMLKERPSEDREVAKIRKILELEKLGANVLPMAADVTDEASLKQAVTAAKEHFGAIHGVIHSAGTPGGGMIQLKTKAMADKVLQPKVKGLLLLQELLKDEPLEVLILNSSLFALTGGFGQVDYCAANLFLDCFAQASYRPFLRMSLNWDAWEDVGMAVKAKQGKAPTEPAQPLLRSIAHPLLDGVVAESDDEIIFRTTLNAKTHWIVDEHRLNQQPVIPGTAYLEMIRAAFAETVQEADRIELSDVFFMQPVRIPDGTEKSVRIRLTRQGEAFAFTVESSGNQTHVTGRVAVLSGRDADPIDLTKIRNACQEKVLSGNGRPLEFLSEKDKTFLSFGPRWESIKAIQVGRSTALFSLELPEAFRPDLESLKLHPALLDLGTGPANGVLLAHMNELGLLRTEEHLYLPLSYKRLRLYRPLTAACFSHSRCRWKENQDQETLQFDITLTNEQGTPLVEVEGFALKRVPENVLKALGPVDQDTKGGNDYLDKLFSEQDKTEGIYPDEGREAFTRLFGWHELPQVAVCTSDLNYRIQKMRNLNEFAGQDAAEKQTSRHPRPALQTLYVAPSSDLEKALTDLWQSVLGLDQVGIHDNFFELGADSVLGIQFVSRAKDKGIMLAVNQLFEAPTVADLARALGKPSAAAAPGGEAQDRELDEHQDDISEADMDALMDRLG